ncbi:MAG: acyl-CoA thioesterase [Chitinophagaceae bacterium]|nr:acyl-CoA thioesterase [Chitinophagaceae bacterium]
MAKFLIELPKEFKFSTDIPIRITDLNYGGHVGNDTILSIIHEARAQFLQQYGYSEKDLGGVETIMSNVVINYKSEIFYGDVVNVSVAVANVSRVSFDMVYLLRKNQEKVVAEAQTGMVCFDYVRKKVVSIPGEVKNRFSK